MSAERAERDKPSFLERLCAQLPIVGALFAGGVLGLVLSVLTYVAADPGSGAATVSLINIAGLVVMIGWTGYVIDRCRKI